MKDKDIAAKNNRELEELKNLMSQRDTRNEEMIGLESQITRLETQYKQMSALLEQMKALSERHSWLLKVWQLKLVFASLINLGIFGVASTVFEVNQMDTLTHTIIGVWFTLATTFLLIKVIGGVLKTKMDVLHSEYNEKSAEFDRIHKGEYH